MADTYSMPNKLYHNSCQLSMASNNTTFEDNQKSDADFSDADAPLHLTIPCSLPLLRFRNSGNTCYANALLASILSNPLMRRFLSTIENGPGQELKSLSETPITMVSFYCTNSR